MTSRGGFRFFERQLLLVIAGGLLVGSAAGCATVAYRVPGLEVQRLAYAPPAERGVGVRVMPEADPLYPSTERPAAARPPVVAPPPVASPPVAPMAVPPGYGPSQVVVETAPPPEVVVTGPDLYVEVDGPVFGPRERIAPPPRVVAARVPARAGPSPARPILSGRPPGSGGGGSGWRGTPVAAPRFSSPAPARFASSVPRPSGSAPAAFAAGAGIMGGGGGGGGGNTAAAVGAAVAVVGLIAVLAVAAADEEEASQARAFDGWVDVEPTHALRLHYRDNSERLVPLNQLRPADTIGVLYGELSDVDGPIQPRPPTPAALQLPAAAPVAARATAAQPAAVVQPATAARPVQPVSASAGPAAPP